MIGRDFSEGTVYKDGRSWFKVCTRGPVITKSKTFGNGQPIVRMTVQDKDGNVERKAVLADKDYQTSDDFPKPSKSRAAKKDEATAETEEDADDSEGAVSR